MSKLRKIPRTRTEISQSITHKHIAMGKLLEKNSTNFPNPSSLRPNANKILIATAAFVGMLFVLSPRNAQCLMLTILLFAPYPTYVCRTLIMVTLLFPYSPNVRLEIAIGLSLISWLSCLDPKSSDWLCLRGFRGKIYALEQNHVPRIRTGQREIIFTYGRVYCWHRACCPDQS